MLLQNQDPSEPPRLIAVLTAQNVSRLQQPVAGVAAMSRILIEASRAGVREAVIAADEPGSLIGAVEGDLKRAGSQLVVAWIPRADVSSELVGRAAGCALVLTGAAIVKGSALERLCATAQDACVLCDRGQVLAARVSCAAVVKSAEEADWPKLAHLGAATQIPCSSRDIVRLDDLAAATRKVLADTGKPSDGLVSRFVNRPMSRSISAAMLAAPSVRPGHATGLTMAAAALMFASFLFGGHIGLIAGCLMFQVASMVDGVDGEIARATFRSSPRGAALDTGVDMATNLLFALGLTLALGHVYGPHIAHVSALALAGLLLGVVLMSVLASRSGGGGSFDIIKSSYARRFSGGAGPKVVQFFKTITSRDFFALLFAAMAIVGLARLIPWLLLIGAGLWLVFIAFSFPALLRAAAPRVGWTAPELDTPAPGSPPAQ